MSRRYLANAEQNAIIERAGGRCEYCQSQMNYSGQSFEFDHIHPVSHAGETSLENLALVCGGCNRYKSNKIQAIDPTTNELVNLFNPRQQRWEKPFGWIEDYTQR